MYTVAEIAQRYRLHDRTIRRAIKDGRLRALKLGHNLRIRQSDLDAFLAACETGDPAA